MKKTFLTALVLLLVLAGGSLVYRRWSENSVPRLPNVRPSGFAPSRDADPSHRSHPMVEAIPGPTRVAPDTSAADEKAARIAKIKKDYEEVRAKISAEYSAAGPGFPGGVNAFLRQLALLEREKRADYAKFLSPRELENLEMQDTMAGQLVQRMLGATTATEEQRRAVFRIQQAFDDQFALTFDITPSTLLAREQARQQAQQATRTALGDDSLFALWLRGEGGDDAANRNFLAQQGLPESLALDLWQAKNDYTLQRLAFSAQPGLSADQITAAQTALTQTIQARLIALLGPAAFQAARGDLLGWLPRGK